MKFLILLLSALSILAGAAPTHAQPASFTAKYGTDLPGQGWSPFGPKFTNRQAVTLTAPANTVAPVASGTAIVGQTLTTTDGTWTGTAPITYTYQWRRDGVNIGSATNNTYVLVTADLGTVIDCNVTATNAAGAVSQDSNNITVGSDLSAVLASAVFDLDATKTASYSGSGTTWANLVTAPADGSAQTAYDFFTGDGSTSTTYPTFNGSAGSAAAYWSFDGGDRFALKSGTNTALINNLGKTTGGSDWTAVFTIRSVDGTWTTQSIFATQSETANNAKPGISIVAGTAETIAVRQRGELGAGSTTNVGAFQTIGDYIVIVSKSHSTNMMRWWVNSATGTEVANTYSTTTTNAEGLLTIGSLSAATIGGIDSNMNLYSFAFLNEYIDNTKAAKIIAALEARHSRDYTP